MLLYDEVLATHTGDLWLFGAVSVFLTYYAVEPLPASLVCRQIGFELTDFMLLGVVVAALYRKSSVS